MTNKSRTKRYLLSVLTMAISAILLSVPSEALEIGEKIPKLSVTESPGKQFSLPNRDLKSPILVWFPLAGRTPNGLIQKLLNISVENKASLVIIPIFDPSSPLDRYKIDISEENRSTLPTTEIQLDKNTPDLSALSLSEKELLQSSPKPPSESSEIDPFPLAEYDNDTAEAENISQETEANKNKSKVQLLQKQFRYWIKYQTLKYPQARIVCDMRSEFLLAYTGTYATNLTPNPNLFIIDHRGFVTWNGFYPGLTRSTLAKAILCSRPSNRE